MIWNPIQCLKVKSDSHYVISLSLGLNKFSCSLSLFPSLCLSFLSALTLILLSILSVSFLSGHKSPWARWSFVAFHHFSSRDTGTLWFPASATSSQLLFLVHSSYYHHLQWIFKLFSAMVHHKLEKTNLLFLVVICAWKSLPGHSQ